MCFLVKHAVVMLDPVGGANALVLLCWLQKALLSLVELSCPWSSSSAFFEALPSLVQICWLCQPKFNSLPRLALRWSTFAPGGCADERSRFVEFSLLGLQPEHLMTHLLATRDPYHRHLSTSTHAGGPRSSPFRFGSAAALKRTYSRYTSAPSSSSGTCCRHASRGCCRGALQFCTGASHCRSRQCSTPVKPCYKPCPATDVLMQACVWCQDMQAGHRPAQTEVLAHFTSLHLCTLQSWLHTLLLRHVCCHQQGCTPAAAVCGVLGRQVHLL